MVALRTKEKKLGEIEMHVFSNKSDDRVSDKCTSEIAEISLFGKSEEKAEHIEDRWGEE